VGLSRIFIHGFGAVSPAGWGVPALARVLKDGVPLPVQTLMRPGWEKPLRVRTVPPPSSRPPFLAHPRLRRSGVMTHHIIAAALEALGGDQEVGEGSRGRLGVIVCMMAGGVTYTRRFYEEVLREPATASPLVFPETVFNAPASHLSAYLRSATVNYTLVGDDGMFLQGLAMAADWLELGHADACLVVGAEEMDWIVADAVRLFRRGAVYTGGAGALYLKKDQPASVELKTITDSFSFTQKQNRAMAMQKMVSQMGGGAKEELLCAGDEQPEIRDRYPGPHLALKPLLGEAFVASAAWQCVAGCAAVAQQVYPAAFVSISGTNQQAIGARLVAHRG
jgi:hypothetical protein